MAFTTKATVASFGGKLLKLSHPSTATGTDMSVYVYLPPQASSGPVPVLWYLSGLTCTPDNCAEKGFLQATASRRGLALVWPDTSPRGLNLPGEADSWDFGVGACYPTQISHGNSGHTQSPQAPASMWTRRTRSMRSITTC